MSIASLVEDLRFGVRLLAKAPLVSGAAAISLGLGIAANTINFSVANGFLFEPFPYEDQDSLAILWEVNRSDTDDERVSPANFLSWRERSRVFEDLIAYQLSALNLTGLDQPKRIQAASVSGRTFELLGRSPSLGRDFTASEAASDAPVIILDHGFWQAQFAGRASVLGETLTLDGRVVTVIGVMPSDFDLLPANADVYQPTELASRGEDRTSRELIVMGRLASSRNHEDGTAELASISLQLEREFPETNEGYTARAVELTDVFPGPTDSRLVVVLSLISSFVLILACANVANLLLSRAAARQQEVALRTALGAGRRRIMRQLLTESLLLAMVGGILGTLLSLFAIPAVANTMPAELPQSFLPRLNANVLAYTVVLSMLAGLLFGIAPALHTFGADLRTALGDGNRGASGSRSRRRLRSFFVTAQIAAALTLLIGGGSLVRVFDNLVRGSHGFEVDGLVTAELTLSEDRFSDAGSMRRFYRDTLDELEGLAGVNGVAAMTMLPRSRGATRTRFTVEGAQELPRNQEPEAGYHAVNDAFFEVMGVPILEGRALNEIDREDAARVVVINENLATRHFSDGDVLGRRLLMFDESYEIIGVCSNVFQTRMPAEGGSFGSHLYFPWMQRPERSVSVALRVPPSNTEALSATADRIRQAVWSVDPSQPVDAVQTLRDHIDIELSGPKVIAFVLTLFGVMALVLAAMGIYGVISHTVGQRTREIGIRMAMGASRKAIVASVTSQGLKLVGVGLLVGAPLAWMVVRGIRATFTSLPMLPVGFVFAVTGLLVAVSWVAAYLPARRAARVEPTRALRDA